MTTPELEGTRPAAVAGRFYPDDPGELRQMVDAMLAQVPPVTGPVPKAIIAPHAGYVFSGPIAASAYAPLAPARQSLRRIILLGPSHRSRFFGLATVSFAAFDTPLGAVPVDAPALALAESFPQVAVLDSAHAGEHALEVQLPFLQVVLGHFAIAPFLAGETQPEEISQVLEALWGGPETCIVVSSDLSHYQPPALARQLDRATANAIEALAPDAVGEQDACGRGPIRGLLQAARHRGLTARTLDLRNSGDTGGPRHEVVGYGAFAFS